MRLRDLQLHYYPLNPDITTPAQVANDYTGLFSPYQVAGAGIMDAAAFNQTIRRPGGRIVATPKDSPPEPDPNGTRPIPMHLKDFERVGLLIPARRVLNAAAYKPTITPA